MAGTWTDLNNQPGVNIDTMLLLTDGRVFVAGGEYNGSSTTSNDTLAAQVYDPRTGPWTAISTPPG